MGTSLGLDIGALLPFGDRNEESSYSEALEVVENGEEFHQTNQIIHGFKIGSKGAAVIVSITKVAVMLLKEQIIAAKQSYMRASFPLHANGIDLHIGKCSCCSFAVLET